MKKLICLFTIICQLSLISLYAADEVTNTTQSETKAVEPQAQTIIVPQVQAAEPQVQVAEPQTQEANVANQEQPAPIKNTEQPAPAKNVEQPVQAKKVEPLVQDKKAEQPVQAKKIEPSVQAKNADQPPVQTKMVLREKVSDQNPLRKIARGTVNVTLGWTEIPRQMIKVNKADGDIAGVFWGPLKGFAFFLGRTAVGVYEVTTFLLPPYKPVVNPEFILSDDNATDNE